MAVPWPLGGLLALRRGDRRRAARPGLEHRRLPAGVRRRGHLPGTGLGHRPRRRDDPVHVLVRPPAAGLDAGRGAGLDPGDDLALTGPAGHRLRADRDAAVHGGVLDLRLHPFPPDDAAAVGGGARGRAVRAVAALGHAPARDLPRQHRGHLDPGRLRARLLAPQAPVGARRGRALRRRRRALQGNDAAGAAGAGRRAVAERGQADQEVLLRRIHRRVHPAHRPVPAVRGPQGRAVVHRRQGIADSGPHVPAEPARFRIGIHPRAATPTRSCTTGSSTTPS